MKEAANRGGLKFKFGSYLHSYKHVACPVNHGVQPAVLVDSRNEATAQESVVAISANGPTRHVASPHDFSRKRGIADIETIIPVD